MERCATAREQQDKPKLHFTPGRSEQSASDFTHLKAETDRRRSQWRASGFAFQLSWCHPRVKGRIASSSSPFQPAIAAWFCNCLAGNLPAFLLGKTA